MAQPNVHSYTSAPMTQPPGDVRRLAAIMFTDIVGYSDVTQRDEVLALALLSEHNHILREVFATHGGKVVKTVGDAFLAEFSNALDAVKAALAVQAALHGRNAANSGEPIRVRIGVHLGDVVFREGDVFGDGVNIAARIQSITDPEGICVSEAIASQVRNKINVPLISKGTPKFKNIEQPVPVYAVCAPWMANGGGVARHKESSRRRLLFAGAVSTAVLLLVVAYFLVNKSGLLEAGKSPASPLQGTSLSTSPSLAVLPFADLSQAQDQEYLGDGLAEEILNQLAQVPALRLVGRTSSFSFKGKNQDLRVIGQKLGVAHLLEGSVRRDGQQLRITAQLIRTEDGTHMWSKTYARDLSGVFALQEEIARDVGHALAVKLDVVTLNRAQGGTTNPDAYDRYLRSRSLLFLDANTTEELRQRVQLAREAVTLDPQFVLGWDELATSLETLAAKLGGGQGIQMGAEVAQIRKRIAEMAPNSWMVKRERAYALWRKGERVEAVALAKEVMDAGPLTYEHAFPYVNLMFALGYLDETVEVAEKLRMVEPLAMFISRDLQFDYTAARRYGEAEVEYQRSLTLEGDHTQPARVAFISGLALKNKDQTALQSLLQQLKQQNGESIFPGLAKILHDPDAMRTLLREMAAGSGRAWDNAKQVELADALGDVNLAASALRREFELVPGFQDGTMDFDPYFFLWTPSYSGLRAHPDFKKILIQSGVADYWRKTGRWGDGCKPVGADDFQCS